MKSAIAVLVIAHQAFDALRILTERQEWEIHENPDEIGYTLVKVS